MSMKKTAILSPCGTFRYRLGRRWGTGSPLLYVMLNPSTADAEDDDPTIRRCIGFGQSHRYNAIEVVNLYAFRATLPKDLKAAKYPVGDDNNTHIAEAVAEAGAVCVAWGAQAKDPSRPSAVLKMIRAAGVVPMVLGLTASGNPRHPLTLPVTCRLQPYGA